MAIAADVVRAELASIVGESQILCGEPACAGPGVDGRLPCCVVYPTSAEQAAQVLKFAAEHGVTVIASGGGSKLGVGNPPPKYDVALCLRDMKKILHYEPADLTAGVEAGTTFQEFQDLLRRDGLWLPLDPPGRERATLGGIVAANASGTLRQLYGTPRDMVLGMRIATTEGKVVKTGGRVVKNVAGYDLGKLMIGSFGTLGVIVEVNLKLFPIPAERETFILSAGTLGIARDLRRSILNSPLEPARLVLLDAAASDLIRPVASLDSAAREPEIWVEASGSKAVIDRTRKDLDQLARGVGAKVQLSAQESSQASWRLISDFSNWFHITSPESVVLKGTMPAAHSEEFLSLAQQEAGNEKVKVTSITQVGVGIMILGLVGSNGVCPMVPLVTRLRKSLEKLGGALTVVAAPVEFKEQVDVWGTPGSGLKMMRKLKAAWDPKGILAPGRFVGGI
ncbi:MAG TPA: FAD-binding oxidoreductase [Terriglobia bacterium]|nr:FAD-binding oxidoreductase [Terriglobia bacterium]